MTSVFNDFNTQVPLTAPVKPTVAQTTVKDALPATNVEANDSVEIKSKKTAKKEKKGLIAGTKSFIASVKKFFASVGIYAKGTAKGIGTGAVVGSAIFGATEILNFVTKKAAHGKQNVLGIALGSLAAIGALASNLWTASLDATEKKSEIEHRYIGHKQ